ncbi:MAG: Flp family type IVb pilin [Proteobacteria bacterium]|nr:Flp family type IVb pilin [Pseudomonadota bacterium]
MLQRNFLNIFVGFSIRLLKSRGGVAIMEYGLLAALISLVLIVALKTLGISLSEFLNYIAETMSNTPAS